MSHFFVIVTNNCMIKNRFSNLTEAAFATFSLEATLCKSTFMSALDAVKKCLEFIVYNKATKNLSKS